MREQREASRPYSERTSVTLIKRQCANGEAANLAGDADGGKALAHGGEHRILRLGGEPPQHRPDETSDVMDCSVTPQGGSRGAEPVTFRFQILVDEANIDQSAKQSVRRSLTKAGRLRDVTQTESAVTRGRKQTQDRRDPIHSLHCGFLVQSHTSSAISARNLFQISGTWIACFWNTGHSFSQRPTRLARKARETRAVIEAPTATKFPPEARGNVVVCGSHGGRYPAYLAAQAGLRAVIFCDAGVGRDGAGIESLSLLGQGGMAAATVSHMTARIGEPADMLARGIISHVNEPARAVGVEPGMPCRLAAERLEAAEVRTVHIPPSEEARTVLTLPGAVRRLVLIDSAAMVEPNDSGQIIVTGSHGGLVGANPAYALRVDGFAAVFNDAGIGIDEAGIARLPALQERGIAAFTVAAESARIGDARSTYEDGVISAVNERARELGAIPGKRAKDVLLAWARGVT